MDMNWSTFLLEIINFLILVWILKHFFYKPVRLAIETRQQAIEKTMADANRTSADAETKKIQYEKRLTDWETEKQEARKKLQVEIGEERKRQMEALQASLVQEKQKSKALEDRRLAEALRQSELTALQQAAQFAARFLGRVASPGLNEQLASIFVEELQKSPQEKQVLLQKAYAGNTTIKIVSAFPLEKKQQDIITVELGKLSGQKASYEFSTDPKLIAGLRVSMGAYVLQASIQDELKFFTEAENDRHAA